MDRRSWIQRYVATRAETECLAARLSDEGASDERDAGARPTRWHLGHTTWFFETFLLLASGGEPFHPAFGAIFDSDHAASRAGPARGAIEPLSAREVAAYRTMVDARMIDLLDDADDRARAWLAPRLALGLAHEELHQELLLAEILATLAASPREPVYRPAPCGAAGDRRSTAPGPARFATFQGGVIEIGARPGGSFAFANERPAHEVLLEPYALAERPITIGEALAFARDGGYRTPSLWLGEGWAWVQHTGTVAPGYTSFDGGSASVFTLHGRIEPSGDAPAAHLSYFEADAIARWLGARLPSEAEWENAAQAAAIRGHFRDDGWLTPRAAAADVPGAADVTPRALFGDVWEWTSSGHRPYPGFEPASAVIGNHDGQFPAGRMVLRGGSCLSSRAHLRATYRRPGSTPIRAQMTGARLARDPR